MIAASLPGENQDWQSLSERLTLAPSSLMQVDDSDCNIASSLISSLVLEIAYNEVLTNVKFAHDRIF